MMTLAPETGISGMDKYLHPTKFCGKQFLIPALDTYFWRQRPHIQTGNDVISTVNGKHIIFYIVYMIADPFFSVGVLSTPSLIPLWYLY